MDLVEKKKMAPTTATTAHSKVMRIMVVFWGSFIQLRWGPPQAGPPDHEMPPLLLFSGSAPAALWVKRASLWSKGAAISGPRTDNHEKIIGWLGEALNLGNWDDFRTWG